MDSASLVGIKLSSSWPNNPTSSQQQTFDESSLDQILHHDLRSVVREDNNSSPCTCGGQLRRAVNLSLRQDQCFKSSLNSDFRLLVQIEEIADISLGRRSRWEMADSVSTSATSNSVCNRNRALRRRCLKFAYSDGYVSEELFVAIEGHTIPFITSGTNVGAKILLSGPIDIRRGVAVWHEGNALFLGGGVSEYIASRNAALEESMRNAGVGVDSTIRALVWNVGGNDGEPEGTDDKHLSNC